MIPKKIHYCWLSGDPFPENIKSYMQTWQEKLPDYEFILWDTNRFDLNTSTWCMQAFEAKKYAYAADYIRLYAVYNYGGIYIDCDIEILKSFNDALDNIIMMAYEQIDDNILEAGCFGAIANHPFIGECLNYYQGKEFIKDDGSYDMKILPLIMSEIMHRDFNITDIVTFEPAIFTSKSANDGKIRVNEKNYCIHHFTSHYLKQEERDARTRIWKIKQKFGNTIGSTLLIKITNLACHVNNKGMRETIKFYKNNLINRIKVK